MYILEKKFRFEAAHWLAGHPGLCSNIHGHSYILTVAIGCDTLTDDMVIDFSEVGKKVGDIVQLLDHALIVNSNEENLLYNHSNHKPKLFFIAGRSTAENVVSWLYHTIKLRIDNKEICLLNVKLQETEGNTITYSGADLF